MRILMQPRPRIFQFRGGDTTQVLETAKELRAQGLTVDISLEVEKNLCDYDVIHLFTTAPEAMAWTYPRFHAARIAKKATVVSTIYWPWSLGEVSFARTPVELKLQTRGFYGRIRSFVPPWIKYGVRWLSGRKPNLKYNLYRILAQELTPKVMERRQQKVWCSADMLLPNSEAEAQIILNAVRKPLRYIVVPNAVNARLFKKETGETFVKRYGIRDFVLCAAMITPRKNQLRLLRALRDLPLVLIGETIRPFAKTYVEACKREAGPNVIFIEAMDQKELASAYAAAKVHVLASEFETPGLSNLEAAVAGCNIVSTTGGCTKEYFGDFAWYCDPFDIHSIHKAIKDAYEAPYTDDLSQRIQKKFTWNMAAKATLKGYESALKTQNL